MSVSITTEPRRAIGRGGWWWAPLPLLGGLLALYLLVPIVVLAVRLASSAGSGLPTAGLGAALLTSLLTASISTAIIALFGIPLAWVLAQRRGRLWEVVGVAVQLPLALPPLMSGILLIEIVGPYTFIGRLFGGRLTDTTAAIVIAQTFVAAPFLIVAARSAFATVDPGLLEIAATLGHGGFARFRRVSLPVAAPGIRAGLLLSWLRAFGEFGATVILAYHPYSLPVFTFVQFTSTGLPSTLPPTGVAILAAAAVLVLALAGLRPGRWTLASARWLWWRVSGGPPPRVPAVDGSPAALAVAGLAGRRTHRAEAGRGGAGPADGAAVANNGHAPVTATDPLGQASTPGLAQRPRTDPAPLQFELHARIGGFELELAHRSRSPHLAILGPSGAGKSFTLRCLAGLRGGGVGEVRLGSRSLSALRPEDRRIGWVPQDAALIPNLSVWDQVRFGVGVEESAAAAWLARMGLSRLAERRPDQLSGGQRQRVALARALARAPDLLLLDEPFSSLDRPVRDELRRELWRLQREVGIATVIVTHDPEEAALLAEEVVILVDGRPLQSGSRREVFERPRSPRVARLLAIDNLRTGRLSTSGSLISERTELRVSDPGLTAGIRVSWCVRAEHVVLRPAGRGPQKGAGDAGAPNGWVEGTVLEVLDLGAWREATVVLDGGLTLTARTIGEGWLVPGGRCRVTIDPAHITVWAETSARQPAPR